MELSANIFARPPAGDPPSARLTPAVAHGPSTASSAGGTANLESDAPVVVGVVGERWPTLARAMGRYEQKVAERFSQAAYDRVEAGVIRLESRRELAALADELNIRPFDAQLLIACAVRKYALDHAYDAAPSKHAPALSFEYKAWHRLWPRLAVVACTAAILDGLIIWKWLS